MPSHEERMERGLIATLGAYVVGTFDSASVRGRLTEEALTTLVNGLVEIYSGGERRFAMPGDEKKTTAAQAPIPDLNNPELLSRLADELQQRQEQILQQPKGD